ncbi:MAG: hypothetical protein ABSC03_06455 [Verrucomicrobiota bacterium]|jgi:hypothetical protein
MKNSLWKLCLMAGFSCLILVGNATLVGGAQDDPPGPDQRLQRLERRINELAERQDQMMRTFGVPQVPQPQMMPPVGVRPERQGQMPSVGPENTGLPMPPTGWRGPVERRVRQDLGGMLRLIALVCILCNILMAIWIFTDIRKRGEGAGIFIALALVAGIPAAIIYALVRIGDRTSATGKQTV